MEIIKSNPIVTSKIAVQGTAEYPIELLDLEDAPEQIFFRGDISTPRRFRIGVVGSRESTRASEAWLRQNLSYVIKDVCIVSGGARGIDQTAHDICLAARQPTWIVLPSGISNAYPKKWQYEEQKIIFAGGVFLSEFSDSITMRPFHFEKRNRLIAALSDLLLIVEGRLGSGTAITLRHAQDLGRPIAVVPWFPEDPRGELGLKALCEGAATPLRDGRDLQVLVSRLSVPNSFHKEERNSAKEEICGPHCEPWRQDSRS